MVQSHGPIGAEIRLPGILRVWSDDISGLLHRERRPVPGPFVLVCRHKGLAIDTGLNNQPGARPHLWSLHAYKHQLWYFRRASHRGEYLIVSIANGLALDARGKERGRKVTMRPPRDEESQRWRMHPAADGAAFVIESVLTRHVLDAPVEAERRANIQLWDRHDRTNQQFLTLMPSGGKPGR